MTPAPPTDEALTRQLRERGLQVTAQRLAVLKSVAQHPHAPAERLADAARQHIGAISRQSVYDALGALVGAGLVQRISPEGAAALYECRVGDNHHHLLCRECGRLEDVDCAVGAAPCLTPADARGFEVEQAQVVYRGLCADCRKSPGAHRP